MSGFDVYVGVCSFLLGAVIGSFLNVVIYRLPEGISLVSPGSRCPQCGNAIRWYHNVPVLGWLVLRGRCRDCGEPISWRYPFVEALTGSLFLAAFVVEGLEPHTLLTMAFFAALVAVTFIDIDHFRIPDKIVLPGAVIGLVCSIALDPSHWWEYLVAAVGGAAFLLVLGLIWSGGMGMGDVKMALMMGAVLGSSIVVAFFVAFLVGGVGGILLIALGIKGRKDRIPFGPYLAIGSVAAALVGDQIIEAYLGVL
jgi:leader peptidase (prepilin peptidase)/N-methyltransferase